MERVSMDMRPRRREYSGEFKESVLEQTRQSGASVAGVALTHGLNPNMVHRWLRESRQREVLAQLQDGTQAFVPLQLALPPREPMPAPEPAADAIADADAIRIEVSRAGGKLTVHWPISAATQCAQMLRELLR